MESPQHFKVCVQTVVCGQRALGSADWKGCRAEGPRSSPVRHPDSDGSKAHSYEGEEM